MLQLLWLTLLAVHAGLAGLWWWIMPGGFPGGTPEYVWFQLLPPIVIVVMLAALVARGKLSEAMLPPVLVLIPTFWMAFGITARVGFIDSFESGWSKYFIGGAILAGLWARVFVRRVRYWWMVVAAAVIGIVAGVSAPNALRSPEPTTRPAGGALAALPSTPMTMADHKMLKLTKEAQYRPEDGRLVVKRGAVTMNVMPMLSFTNRSPDRCWTSLAPEGASKATNRVFAARAHSSFWYKDEDVSVVEASAQGAAVTLDARSRLQKPIYSHANSFVELAVSGHKKLTLAFSPVPDKRIDVPSVKQNARFAYVDAAGGFHVVEAAKQRRGPFTELASGTLRAGAPLTVTLYDGDKPLFAVALEDYVAQASTDVSPAAGWGVPQNAIEFMRGGDAETTPVLVTASLAATTVGQGTATVGHAAGVYRNRMSITVAP